MHSVSTVAYHLPFKHTALSERPLLCGCENGVERMGPIRGGRCTHNV